MRAYLLVRLDDVRSRSSIFINELHGPHRRLELMGLELMGLEPFNYPGAFLMPIEEEGEETSRQSYSDRRLQHPEFMNARIRLLIASDSLCGVCERSANSGVGNNTA